jgi:hypothetical protein
MLERAHVLKLKPELFSVPLLKKLPSSRLGIKLLIGYELALGVLDNYAEHLLSP